ncbi:MAG: hypothetical protein OEM19_02555 [Deltaproteobacteria bacterium]|nr:hypothetical protein [Deltaproteobacteria bacterium]
MGGSLSPGDGIVLEDLGVLGVRIVSCARPYFIVRRRTVSNPARWFHRPEEAAERNGWLIRYHLLWYFLFTPCIARGGEAQMAMERNGISRAGITNGRRVARRFVAAAGTGGLELTRIRRET